MKIGIIGTGNVGRALAAGLVRTKHQVTFGSRNPSKAEHVDGLSVGSRKEAATWADIVVLAVPFSAVRDTVTAIGPNAMNRKIVVDATNAVGPSGLAVGFSTSGAEELAKLVPGAKVVKAFNTVFAPLMSAGTVGGEPIVLPVAGDDAEAKESVMRLGADVGFDPVDAGPLKNARFLEPLAMWMIYLAYGAKMGPGIGLRLLRTQK